MNRVFHGIRFKVSNKKAGCRDDSPLFSIFVFEVLSFRLIDIAWPRGWRGHNRLKAEQRQY